MECTPVCVNGASSTVDSGYLRAGVDAMNLDEHERALADDDKGCDWWLIIVLSAGTALWVWKIIEIVAWLRCCL